jgi:hypothetical protein
LANPYPLRVAIREGVLALAFPDRFADAAVAIDRWNELANDLEVRRKGFNDWIRGEVEARKFDRSPFARGITRLIAREAESDEPSLDFETTAGQLRAGAGVMVDLARVQQDSDREQRTKALLDFFDEAVARDERAAVVQARQALEDAQGPLLRRLDEIKVKAATRGRRQRPRRR